MTPDSPKPARLLDCGFCFEEHGEEVHPHPECPITTVARYHRRADEVHAVQWTSSNEAELRAFAGQYFDTIDPEDRIEDPDQDAQLLVEASHWVGIKPGDWVVKYEGYFVAKADATFRAVWEPAAVYVPPPADQTALRDRIAEALYAHNHPGWATRYSDLDQDERDTYLARADAVLAVLPEQTDRAAVLLEAADFLRDAHFRDGMSVQEIGTAMRHWADRERPAVGEQPETQETPVLPCSYWTHTRTEHTPHRWVPQPGMDPVHCPGYDKASE